MSTPPDVLWVFDNETDGKTFERLCVDLLGRNGYAAIVPFGGMRDHARDAEMTSYTGRSRSSSLVFFQFSLEASWQRKLRAEAEKICKCGHLISELIFVTSRGVTGETRDKLKQEFKGQYGWELTIYEREWLRYQLEEHHPDLAKKYLGVSVPQTAYHVEMILSSSGLLEDEAQELFKKVSPTELKARLLKKIKDGLADWKTWRTLADVEYRSRDYDASLKAINEALALSGDGVDRLNLGLFKGAILAEHGIKKNSRPLLVQAKEIFTPAVQKLGRSIDHYNLANVLGPLSDLDGAERHYRLCLDKEPQFAEAWKNLGTTLEQKGDHNEAMRCFEKALSLKPNLVEAFLCMGMTYLRVFKKPEDAVRCFVKAYQIAPDLDKKWNHVQFWLSEALLKIEKLDEALTIVEHGLHNRPDDTHLLRQKARLLTKLWRSDSKYENAALTYFKYRAVAVPGDCWTIIQLIDIFAKRGASDEACTYLDLNFDCKPYRLSDLGKRAKFTLQDFKEGFRHETLYNHYRSFMSLKDHCIVLHNQGLYPDMDMLRALDVLLMVPFGYTFEQMRKTKGTSDVLKAFETAWHFMKPLFPVFSVNWISKSKPATRDEQIRLASLALILLPEIALAETVRHINFIAGSFDERLDMSVLSESGRLKEIYSDIAIPWMEIAFKDWNFVPNPVQPTSSG